MESFESNFRVEIWGSARWIYFALFAGEEGVNPWPDMAIGYEQRCELEAWV